MVELGPSAAITMSAGMDNVRLEELLTCSSRGDGAGDGAEMVVTSQSGSYVMCNFLSAFGFCSTYSLSTPSKFARRSGVGFRSRIRMFKFLFRRLRETPTKRPPREPPTMTMFFGVCAI